MMINWKNVRLIFLREGRDQLRDRRTLFMIAVLPLLLYPALGIGMVQLTVLFSEQSRTVVLLGEKDLPGPPLLSDGHFAPNWFRHREDAEKLAVVTDGPPAARLGEAEAVRRAEVLEHARELRQKIELKERLEADRDEIERQLKDSEQKQSVALAARLQSVTQQLHDVQTELGKLFSASQIQVLVIIPEGFAENIARVNQSLAKREQHEPVADYARPVIVHNKADEKSQIAVTRVRDVMDRWEDEILKRRLELAQLPSSLPNPVKPKHEDVALETQVAANVWSKLFPALLVIMSITGAFYPAIDLCAGEKERGTMETLLICPATRTEIVLGKFFTVLCFSISTAVLNLMSMGLTGQHMASMVHVGGTDAGLSFPSWPALAAIILFLIPLASLFSALCLSLATFARSSKEGQYYLTPLLMGTLGLTVFCLSPGVELTPFYSIMPVAGVSLLLKGLLLAQADSHHLYWYAIPVLGTTFIYSALALWWAIDQFQREDVLFREAERFELGLWIRHLLRDKEPTPSFTEAGFCLVLIMLLQFASFKAMAQAST
ncbi:MAG TPA: ABC transporter permease subunit, partial [Planctomycetaceae bacterium]|nr:ABC transporter permease subunit [Planctomycetaceae bacterium]